MIIVRTFASLLSDLVTALGLTFLFVFITLAYFEPTTLDSVAHNAHHVIPQIIDGFIAFIKNPF